MSGAPVLAFPTVITWGERLTERYRSVCGHVFEVIDERESGLKGTQGTERSREVEEKLKVSEQSDVDTGEFKRHRLLRRFWKSAAGFWGKREERLSWVLSGALLLIILLNLATSYGMNLWNREIFDALEKRDSQTVLFLSMLYFPLLVASVLLSVTQVYTRMTMQRRWRAWLNNHLVDRWFRTAAITSSIWSAATTKTPNTASPTTSGSRPKRRSISSPA